MLRKTHAPFQPDADCIAREIKELIADSLSKVGNVATLVHRSGESLAEIVKAVKRVTDVVSEIAAASHEQSMGVEEVNRAVTQMDEVTQSNAAQTEELSGTAAHLSDQEREVHSLVSRFKLASSGDSAAASVAEPTVPRKRDVPAPVRSDPPREALQAS